MTPSIIMLCSSLLIFVMHIAYLANSPKENKFSMQFLFIGCLAFLIPNAWISFYAPNLIGINLFIEPLKHVFFITFLYRLTSPHIVIPKHIMPISFLAATTMIASPFSLYVNTYPAVTFAFSGIVLSLIQLIFCERLFQISKKQKKAHSKLIMGLVIITLIDFTIYCAITLSSTLSEHHLVYKTLAIVFSSYYLYKGLLKLNQQPIKVSISRPIAFQGLLLLLSGTYLFAIGIGSYLVKTLELDLTYTTQTVMFAAALFPLSAMFMSQRIRRELMVWTNKHFFAGRFDYRTTWLTILDKMDPNLIGKEAHDQALNVVLNAISHHSGAFIYLSSCQPKVLTKIAINISDKSMETITALAPYLERKKWVIDIPGAINNPEDYPKQDVVLKPLAEDGVKWLAPVVKNGTLHAILVVGETDHKSWDLNWETRDFLVALAEQLERYTYGQSTREKLSEHAQLAAFHQTSAFVIHDLKNIHAQLKMLNKNSIKHRDNAEFINDTFLTTLSMETRLNKTLEQITNKNQPIRNQRTATVLADIIKDLEPLLQTINGNENIVIKKEIDVSNTPIVIEKERMINVIKHLVDNAIYASKKSSKKEIIINFQMHGNYVKIDISDNGSGMSSDFIENKLFKPFETTKGNAGMGLGVYDAKTFAQNHQGNLSVISEEGKGTTFTLLLPRSGNE